ncbi:MAG TPA: hypothetical protein VFP34_16835 [Microlunatus sp.]|nr:hypothetical protein [Microlunatus sp.]
MESGSRMTSVGGVYDLRLGSANFCVGVPWLDIWCCPFQAGSGNTAFMIMQGDGNLCVYPGTGGQATGPAIWASNSQQSSTGDFYAVLLDDATLEVHKGTDPENDRGVIWSCVKDQRYKIRPNPVVKIEKITAIDYDLAAGVIREAVPNHDLGPGASVTYTNHSPDPQSVKLTLKAETTRISQWSDALEVGISVEAKMSCGVPLVAEGEITVTAEVKNTYTWGGSETKVESYELEVPLVVAPGQTLKSDLSSTRSLISVPYTVHCTLTLDYADRSENRKGAGTYAGIYEGANSSDFEVNTNPVGIQQTGGVLTG